MYQPVGIVSKIKISENDCKRYLNRGAKRCKNQHFTV